MRNYRWLSIALWIALSCSKPLPVLEGLNMNAWKEDTNGCGGKRIAMEAGLREEKQKLLALSERQVIAVLGRPDQNELLRRNQKFYTYFIEPSPDCKNITSPEKPKRLVVRFNATGLAKEVTLE